MLASRSIDVDHDHLPAAPQSRTHSPQECVGFAHFMIHMNEKNAIKTCIRQLWIIRRAQPDEDIVEPFALNPLAKPLDRELVDILRQHPALGTDPSGQTHGVITVTRANIGHGSAILYRGEVHHDLRLAYTIAQVLSRKAVAPQC